MSERANELEKEQLSCRVRGDLRLLCAADFKHDFGGRFAAAVDQWGTLLRLAQRTVTGGRRGRKIPLSFEKLIKIYED